MTQDEIIELARQAGFHEHDFPFKKFKFEAFAKLVEERTAAKATDEANARANSSWTLMCKKMVAAEREACAQVAFSWNTAMTDKVAKEIRARGEA